MTQDIEGKVQGLGYKIGLLTNSLLHQNFVNSLYEGEPFPIYEHNWHHCWSYLSFDHATYVFECSDFKSVVIVNADRLAFFTPYGLTGFSQMINVMKIISGGLGYDKVTIQNISQNWLESRKANDLPVGNILPRSEREAVYSTDTLNGLAGNDFAGLRQTRNRLLGQNQIVFRELSRANLSDAHELIDKWNVVQGMKYSKVKKDKEKFLIQRVSEYAGKYGCYANIGYYESRPISLCVYLTLTSYPEWGIIYLLKGINREEDGGKRGATDATYLFVNQQLRQLGVKYANDGDLGKEQGTIDHKMRFKPVSFLKSYDVELNVRSIT